MVITFWPHPRNVLQKEARSLRLLTTLAQKKQILHELGVDRLEVLSFTKDFSAMTMEQYLRHIMKEYGATAILLGYDNRMGSDAANPDQVARTAEMLGLEVVRTDMVSSEQGYAVSSTKIREKLEEGDVKSAAEMLGYDYSMHGVVVAGNKLGRTIGFPTANMQLYEPLKLVPGNGVYFVKVKVLDRELYGMCNIGCRPTVGSGNARTIETNIFDFDEDIYGLDIDIKFMARIREEQKFDSMDKLKAQLELDRMECLDILNEELCHPERSEGPKNK
jgi:riboflavin kinase/FMN adenylyltransferase